MEKRELLCTVGGNANGCSQYGKQYRISSKILKIELSHDLAIPLEYLSEVIRKDICTPMFILALFAIAKI